MTRDLKKQETIRDLKTLAFKLESVIEALKELKRWGFFDLFDNGILTSWVKRQKISAINESLEDVRNLVCRYQKELKVSELRLPSSLSHTRQDKIFDIWLDNSVTDFRVLKETKQVLESAELLYEAVQQALSHLDVKDS
ncbi:hypothetical protein KUG02_05225 [Streptococcus equi subsp. zooepidemicus]|uniref:Phage protein n=2 Tax=Streptococcus equi subsp. zooepidemicus TaxID=40041 RepID=A0ABP2X9J1_STRSZ|nr:hypothetical protein [Streptococcus equi]KIS11798.1 hypothetical protein AT50_01193 [Streptococcus equi subsp. zooepidemicus Sz105]KIS16649.1 hypothetical protein AT55_00920 [Streptococcus equi subsp. zooepidemicus Sz4is]EQB23204.1 hypothetical protein M837_01412 [Streptococcus equi subsp. zooepidemicus SzS31A1]KIS04872.1 hypothetical protein AT54_00610 [Streptococcus equi subsp. zooepidemicus Sz12is]MCD3383757.1 hypothetical protein [Streptococcus equi subsp. zooepidemicus]